MIEAYEAGDFTCSTLVSIARRQRCSPDDRDRYVTAFPNTVVIDAIRSSETGFGGMSVVVKGQSHVGAPQVKADPETHVLREDGTPVEAGSGEVGVLARSGYVPLRYHNDPEKSAGLSSNTTVRYSLPGDFATLEEDGTITMLGRGSVSINSGGEKVF